MALPIDSSRLVTVLAAEQVAAVAEYGQADASGRRQRIEGAQGRDKATGLPMWTVHVVIVHSDGSPPEMAKVKVVSQVAPVVDGAPPFTPVVLRDLVATPWVDGGRISTSWKCSGVEVMMPSVSARKNDAA